MTRSYIRYPQGAGGAWLSMLVNKIANQDLRWNKNDHGINFHFYSDHTKCLRGHPINDHNDILFSSNTGFNFYLNFWWKTRVFGNYHDFNEMTDYQKLHVLSDEARWILYDQSYKDCYQTDVAIDWIWIWQDIAKFKSSVYQIFSLARTQDIDSFVDSQCDMYKKSCVRAKYHLGNPFSLPWLGWCCAIISELGLTPDIVIEDSAHLPLLANYVQKNNEKFVEITVPHALLDNNR